MRFLSLILLLTSFAFSAVVPNGTKYYVDITINSASVGETSAHHLLQRDLSSLLSNANIKANFDSTIHLKVTTPTDTAVRPKWLLFTKLDSTKMFLHCDAPVSTTENKVIRLCFSKSFTSTNSTAAFTNCGITNFWGFDNPVDGTTAIDYAGGITLTEGGGVTLGGSGKWYNCSQNITSSAHMDGSFVPTLVSTQSFTISGYFMYTFNFTSSQVMIYFNDVVGFNNVDFYQISGALRIYMGMANYLSYSTASLSLNTWYNYVVTFDGTLAEAERLKLYVNATQVSGTITGTIPTTTSASNSTTRFGHNSLNAFQGKYDNVFVASDIKSPGSITTSYNMTNSPTTFSTLGAVKSTVPTGSKWSAYKSAYRSAFKPAYK